MRSELERQILERLLPSTGSLVEIGRAPSPDLDLVRSLRPRFTFHPLAPEAPLDAAGPRRISLLQLNTSPPDHGVLAMLRTGLAYLRQHRIDLIRFDYGPLTRDAGESLFDLNAFLAPFGFSFLRLQDGAAQRIARIPPGADRYEPATFYAVSARLVPLLLQGPQPDSRQVVPAMFDRYALARRGVVHVGAHTGEELGIYKSLGFQRVLFVEANPQLAADLKKKTANDPTVTVVHAAAAAHDGEATLHITSMDESSSILPLKIHKELYPQIDESSRVTVPARRIDTILAEAQVTPADFNYLHLDIQGAEYLALQGAPDLLRHIDALTTEINYAELYAGCALFDDLDDLLASHGFEAKLVNCPYNASWGDAFYLRKTLSLPHKKPGDPHAPVVSMSTLGTNGRYGNQLFQYAFLRLLAHHHGLRVHTSPWVGQGLFGHADPPPTVRFPPIFEGRDIPDAVFPSTLLELSPANREFWGYFQFDTVHYAPFKDFLRSLYQPVPALRDRLVPALQRLRGSEDRPLVALHIRRGDYKETGLFFAAPSAWYLDWLRSFWPTLNNPLLYIASDEPDKVLPDFAAFNPMTARDLAVDVPAAPYYPDFWVLSQADHVATSNSSFSFFATLLSEPGRTFLRPNLLLQQLVPYDPWNTAPLLHRDLGEPIPHPQPPPPPAPQPAAAPAAASVQHLGQTPTGGRIISFKKPGQP